MKRTVFYSWQSDLPNLTNRGFVEVCLEKAIKDATNEHINLEIAIDHHTKNSPGTVRNHNYSLIYVIENADNEAFKAKETYLIKVSK